MFNKRLFRRYSFVLILLLIPVLIPVAGLMMSQGSGIMNVGLCNINKNNQISQEIIQKLTNEESALKFKIYSSENEIRRAVETKEIDTAWVFGGNFDEDLIDFADGKTSKAFVSVISQEDSIPLQLSREKLYAALYPYISYEIYSDFVKNSVVGESVNDKLIRDTYNKMQPNDKIVELKKLNSNEKVQTNDYLVTPLRGLLAIVMMFCGFAAVMYFLRDQAEGKYDWLSYKKRMAPAFGSCLAAISVSAVAVLLGLFFAKLSTGFIREILSMVLYIIAATGFCLILCTIFRSAAKLGATLPFFMIIMLIFCPIFFSVNFLPIIRYLIPTYYYLNAIYNARFLLYMFIYCVAVYGIAFILNIILNIRERHISH